MAWPVPYACAQPYHQGSGSHGQLRGFRPHQHGKAVGQQQDQKPYVVCPLLPRRVQSTPLRASSKQHMHVHVGAGGWEPHGSSPTVCEGGDSLGTRLGGQFCHQYVFL